KLKMYGVIDTSGKSLLKIINDILDYSKIDSGNIDLESKEFNIVSLFNEIVTLFKSESKKKTITLNLNIDENVSENYIGDSTRVNQVISNLLSNAIKFSHQDSQINVRLKQDDSKKVLHVEVEDFGIGISKDNIEKIFDAFGQADSSTTREFGGTGLGLTITSSLIESMGGELNVTSTLGEGSKFSFTLPL
ncbi:MAG: ATP-binding protein, partial [Campylobacterota bacterium]|nr:ATP-binding protein [Campylobacterota bacterium]